MDHNPNPADSAANPAGPAVREIATWLLGPGNDQNPSPEAFIVAAETAYAQLRTRLVVSLGELGFEALWARAIRLAVRRGALPAMHQPTQPLATSAPALRALVGGYDTDRTYALLMDIFASFFGLLGTFIGETLMFRIIQQLWPALNDGTVDPRQPKELDHDNV